MFERYHIFALIGCWLLAIDHWTMYKFEQLDVWNKSVELIEVIYALCATLPTQEKNNINDQIRRATVSISLNIAEGSGSQNDKEFCRYLYLSRKSLFEVIAILSIIERLYKKDISQERALIETVGKLLNGLINKLKDSQKLTANG